MAETQQPLTQAKRPPASRAAIQAVPRDAVRIGIDIGGTGIKGAPVGLSDGTFTAKRVKLPTPHPARIETVVPVVAEVFAQCAAEGGAAIAPDAAVGITFPGVVIAGVTHTAANMHHSWIGADAASLFGTALGRPVTVLNDADAAGVAEAAFGAAKGVPGVVLVLTLGTGIGSALLLDGRLAPNTELGHIEIHGKDAERRAAAIVRENKDLSWHEWAERLQEYLQHIEALLAPDLIVLGGGVSTEAAKFLPRLSTRAELVPALLANRAGIVGAAMAAHERA